MKHYNFRPRFRSDNGHLYIESATDHNISLSTKGHGYINVNNENLLQVVGMVGINIYLQYLHLYYIF